LDVFEITVYQVVSQNVILLTDRQRSASLSDALSSEDFTRASADNAAEAVSKITGVNIVDGKYAVIRGLGDRYWNTLMNGAVLPSNDPSKKSVKLDIIPSGLLEKIVTTKSFTPEKPEDFTGGSVEITTKPFSDEFVLTASIGQGYNNATGEDILGIPGRNMDFLGDTLDAHSMRFPVPFLQLRVSMPWKHVLKLRMSEPAFDLGQVNLVC
jgi:hypothetical protein